MRYMFALAGPSQHIEFNFRSYSHIGKLKKEKLLFTSL